MTHYIFNEDLCFEINQDCTKEEAECLALIQGEKHETQYEISEKKPASKRKIYAEMKMPSTIRILIKDAEYSPESVFAMSPEERLEKVLTYEGIIGYTGRIIRWTEEYFENI